MRVLFTVGTSSQIADDAAALLLMSSAPPAAEPQATPGIHDRQ
jgi:hypothetical protein